MPSVTAIRSLEENTHSLAVEWWIGSFAQDLQHGIQYHSEVFPEGNHRHQFRLKLSTMGTNPYLVQLSFCIWKATFGCEHPKVPSVTVFAPPGGDLQISTSALLLPTLKAVGITFENAIANRWLPIYQYGFKINTAQSPNGLHIKLTLSHPEDESIDENILETLTLCDFKSLLDDETYADVTVTSSDGVQRRAHKTVLVARSKVFHAMFQHDMAEGRRSELHLADVSGEVLDELLRFLYLGCVPDVEADCKALLALADKYELPALKIIAQERLYRELTVHNAADTLAVALLHDAVHLKKFTLMFIRERGVRAVMSTAGWQDLNKTSELSSVLLDFLY